MEHPPLAVFVNGVSAAMNELRPCAPLSLKRILAQELVKGLQVVADSLLRYNTTRMLRNSESVIFLALCRAYLEVVFPHCAMCFGRCSPGGVSLIIDSKYLFDGTSRLVMNSPPRELPKTISTVEGKNISENGNLPSLENGVVPNIERAASANLEEQQNDINMQDGERITRTSSI